MSRRKNDGMFESVSNRAMADAINEWIKSKQDRRIMTLALIDHATFAKIAEAEGLTERTISRRVHKLENILYKHI